MIELRDISFSYGANAIIRDLSLRVNKGSWLGLIGPNGAGKTTLLQLISGALIPSSGGITIDQRDAHNYTRREMAKKIAIVPQGASFAFSFSTLEIVLMGRAPYLKHFGFETPNDLEAAKRAMELTDTWQFRDRPIDQLSGGERQRVLIARALTQEPEILLLDEPTTFLDIRHQVDIMGILADLNGNSSITIISAIHDINLAISYCDTIALLHEGNIRVEGKPEDVITYANLKEIFETDVYVGVNEFTGKPYYVPMQRDGE